MKLIREVHRIARIPFVPRGRLEPEQVRFIRASRGGSPFLLGGVAFWLVAGIAALGLQPEHAAVVYLVGGVSVPVLGFAFARLQRVDFSVLRTSPYTSLVVIAAAITPFSLPVLFALAAHDPRLVPPSLTIIDAAHFLVLMWVQLDYWYFLAAYAKFIIGMVFLFATPDAALVAAGILSALVSLLAAIMVRRASKDPQAAYAPK